MLEIYWLEIKRSPLKWWAPLFLLIDLAMLFGRSRSWIGVWPQASAAAQLAGHAFVSLAAAAVTWNAGREHRDHATDRLRSSWRPGWHADAIQLCTYFLYIMLPYALGVAFAAFASYPKAEGGFIWPSYIFLGASTLLSAVLIGHLAGKLIKGTLASTFTISVSVFALSFFGSRVLELVVLSGAPQMSLSAKALAARISLTAALLLAAICLPQLVRKSSLKWPGESRPYTKIFLTVLVPVTSIALVVSAGPLRVVRTPPAHAMCSTQSPKVCIWPEHAKYLTSISAMAARLGGLPANLFKVPHTFYERGVRKDNAPHLGFLLIEDESSVPDSLAGTVLEESVPVCDIPDKSMNRYLHSYWSLQQWLAVRAYGKAFPGSVKGGPPGVDMHHIYQIARLSEGQQIEWAKERFIELDRYSENCRTMP